MADQDVREIWWSSHSTCGKCRRKDSGSMGYYSFSWPVIPLAKPAVVSNRQKAKKKGRHLVSGRVTG
ncbi:MAG: hypothetical protein ACOY9Y_06045 [Bacillota bacterium]